MLYVHKPTDLSRKAAEVESVYLIREAKTTVGFPLADQKVATAFAPYLLSAEDLENIKATYKLISPVTERLQKILGQADSLHEKVNLQRTLQILRNVPLNLINNLNFSQEILQWQDTFLQEVPLILNSVPKLRTKEEKIIMNQKISQWFEKILRNQQFMFNNLDIIHEGHKTNLGELSESMQNGFFFHVSLEEELKKLDFGTIKQRISAERLQEATEIETEILKINEGIEKTYQANLRLVHLAVLLYAYVKWVNTSI